MRQRVAPRLQRRGRQRRAPRLVLHRQLRGAERRRVERQAAHLQVATFGGCHATLQFPTIADRGSGSRQENAQRIGLELQVLCLITSPQGRKAASLLCAAGLASSPLAVAAPDMGWLWRDMQGYGSRPSAAERGGHAAACAPSSAWLWPCRRCAQIAIPAGGQQDPASNGGLNATQLIFRSFMSL